MSLLMGGVINSMFFFGSLFPTFFLDKFGRRRPMIIGSLLCGISMMMIAALLSPQQTAPGTALADQTSKASVAFFFTVSLVSPLRLSSAFRPLTCQQYMLCVGTF